MFKLILVLCLTSVYGSLVTASDVSTTTATTAEAEAEAETPTIAKDKGATYTIKKGDTLWRVSLKYYNDPKLWPQIWEANKNIINNPHLIFPEQIVSIPDKPAFVTEAEEVEEEPVQDVEEEIVEEEEPEPEPKEVKAEEPPVIPESGRGIIHGESFIAPLDWAVDGKIVGDKDRKLLIAAGDTVYVNLASDKVKPGMRCYVYRMITRVKDPDTKNFIGYEVRRIGQIEFTDAVGEKMSTAKVVMSYEPLQLDDVVKLSIVE